MLLEPLERLRPLVRILQQLPDAAFEILRAPACQRRDRQVDPGEDEREDEEEEDQANRHVERREVQHAARRWLSTNLPPVVRWLRTRGRRPQAARSCRTCQRFCS